MLKICSIEVKPSKWYMFSVHSGVSNNTSYLARSGNTMTVSWA